jgi:catalase-peroxidase
MSNEAKCPFPGGASKHRLAGGARTNADWWPNQLNLKILHQHSPLSNLSMIIETRAGVIT